MDRKETILELPSLFLSPLHTVYNHLLDLKAYLNFFFLVDHQRLPPLPKKENYEYVLVESFWV